MAAQLNATPVPREPLLQVPVLFHAKGEADCLNPLPLVSAARSRRQELITPISELRGCFPALFDIIGAKWRPRPIQQQLVVATTEPSATPRAGRVDWIPPPGAQ